MWYFRAALLLGIISLPTLLSATTILAVRTSTDIYIGVDSKVTQVRPDGSLLYLEQCKIVQVGNIFFAAAGPYGRQPTPFDDPRSGLDIRSSLLESQALGGTIYQIIARFTDLYAGAMVRSLQAVVKSRPKQFEKVFSSPVHVFFFAFDADTALLLHKRFTHRRSDALASTIEIVDYDCPPSCAEPHHVDGIGYADIFKNVSPTVLKTRSPIEVIRETVESSIKADPEKQSDLPVDVLHLNNNGAKWIQKKAQCPEIQP